jgi:transcriptional regulator with PAS, ATPase and Fis domain
MKEACALAARVAVSDANVLIAGESGVGKGLLARYIHERSGRAGRPFIAANCAVFHDDLLASELFGQATGGVTGERTTRGLLSNAHLGTLFLDEVSDLTLRMQATLLRFLETREVPGVGAPRRGTTVNVRVISASNRDLTERMDRRQFRQDLLYRLNVIQIEVPPLRHRREDVRPLIERTVARSGRQLRFTPNALAAMESYRWPGNVRELQNIVERMTLSAASDVIDRPDLPSFLFARSEIQPPTFIAAADAERSDLTLPGWLGRREHDAFMLGATATDRSLRLESATPFRFVLPEPVQP